jgi:hypothetical protein
VSSEFELKPGVVVGSKYRVIEPLPIAPSQGRPERLLYVGTDTDAQAPVLLMRVTAEELTVLSRAVGLQHAHLATVLAALDSPEAGGPVLVVEHVPGPSLDAVIHEMGAETAVEAVRSALRVADALSALHHAGAAHGFVRPESVVLAPEGRKPPCLAFAPGVADVFSRGAGQVPTPAQDAWCVAALLFQMLTGKHPPQSGFGSDAELEAAGVADSALRAALLHGLGREASARAQDITPIKRELARWFVDHAGDDHSQVTARGSMPPPLPVSSTPPPERRGVPRPAHSQKPAASKPRSRGLVIGLATLGFVVALGAAWGISAMQPRHVVLEVASTPVRRAPPAASSAPRIDLSEVAVSGDETGQCVNGFLPKGAFGERIPDFTWMCKEPNLIDGAPKLKAAVVAPRADGATTDASKVFSQLGWYELAAYGVIYRACCAEATALVSPDPGPKCAKLGETVEKVAADSLSGAVSDEALSKLKQAFECEADANRAAVFKRKGRPAPSEETAFRELLKSVQGS